MKKVLLFLMSSLFLSACTTTDTLHTFSIDARTKDVALENLVIVTNGAELYIQPTYQFFAIEHTNDEPTDLVQQASFGLYDEDNTLFYSVNMGANQAGVLDTRTDPLEGNLIGSTIPSKNIEAGKNISIEFTYEKNNQEITKKVEVALQESK